MQIETNLYLTENPADTPTDENAQSTNFERPRYGMGDGGDLLSGIFILKLMSIHNALHIQSTLERNSTFERSLKRRLSHQNYGSALFLPMLSTSSIIRETFLSASK